MAKLKFSPKAEHDLQSIWDYTLEMWSEAQADKYVEKLMLACRAIVGNPSLGHPYDNIPKEILGYRESRHVVIYQVISPTEIEIVRILHVGMDIETRIIETI